MAMPPEMVRFSEEMLAVAGGVDRGGIMVVVLRREALLEEV